jgi:hypothetical protein
MPIPAPTLFLDREQRRLHDGAGLVFDPASLAWKAGTERCDGAAVDPVTALCWLQKESGTPARQPVGVVGGHHATHAQLARHGGSAKNWRRRACCACRPPRRLRRSARAFGGVSIGLLPENDRGRQSVRDDLIPLASGSRARRHRPGALC